MAIAPVPAEDLELTAQLSDPQAERLWKQLAAERQEGKIVDFAGSDAERSLHGGSDSE